MPICEFEYTTCRVLASSSPAGLDARRAGLRCFLQPCIFTCCMFSGLQQKQPPRSSLQSQARNGVRQMPNSGCATVSSIIDWAISRKLKQCRSRNPRAFPAGCHPPPGYIPPIGESLYVQVRARQTTTRTPPDAEISDRPLDWSPCCCRRQLGDVPQRPIAPSLSAEYRGYSRRGYTADHPSSLFPRHGHTTSRRGRCQWDKSVT